ncbi:MAG: hypothetical protein IK144_11015 [Bacteroidaceae bacterium]|nr:hypothetical protein [Bacteroidaceae bacterium]
MTIYEKVISDINGYLDDESKKQSIAQALLCNETTNEEISLMFTNIWVARFIDFTLLKLCIDYYTKKQNIIHLFDPIGERAQSLHIDSPHELEEYAFELVISTNGYERFIGRHLWDEFEMEKSDLDILSLPEEKQIRFAISILQDLIFPQRRLKKLMPLFNSSSKEVRKVLIDSLSLYTMMYYNVVKKTFMEFSFIKTEELELFEELLQSLETRYELELKCKELHIEYMFPDVYDICKNKIPEHIRKQFNLTLNDDSFLSTVIMGRGGGWRDKDGNVHQLTQVSYPLEFPKMLQSMTPLEYNEYTDLMFKDWSKQKSHDEAQNY